MTGALAVLAGIALAVAGPATSAVAGPAEGPVRGEGSQDAIAGAYIVVLKERATEARAVPQAARTLTSRHGGHVKNTYRNTVRGFSASLTKQAAHRLAADPAVAYVEQDAVVSVDTTQSDPVWGIDRIDQRNLPLSKSYTYAATASNVTAYILDTGIRTSHTEFGGRAKSGWDFVDNDATAQDPHGHGTHVAGTIGGAKYGVAKGVKLVGVRVLNAQGSGSYSQIIAGVDWVTDHAAKPAVANMSIGGPTSNAFDDAVRRSIASGVTYAVSAGNNNTNACSQSPARTAEAITVGSTTNTDARSSFSNYGTCVDIFAPGSSITSAGISSDTATKVMSGTSMASPHVAGAAALHLAANPSATPQEVRDALVASATSGKVTNPGSGSPNKLLFVPTTAPVQVTACPGVSNTGDVTIRSLTTITSTIGVSGCDGKASSTSTVAVNIYHDARGDLEISLLAPDSTEYRLKNISSTDKTDNVQTTYTVNLSTENRNGTWTLRVKDRYSGNTGHLEAWTLTV
jgi:subtilisin family serine protease